MNRLNLKLKDALTGGSSSCKLTCDSEKSTDSLLWVIQLDNILHKFTAKHKIVDATVLFCEFWTAKRALSCWSTACVLLCCNQVFSASPSGMRCELLDVWMLTDLQCRIFSSISGSPATSPWNFAPIRVVTQLQHSCTISGKRCVLRPQDYVKVCTHIWCTHEVQVCDRSRCFLFMYRGVMHSMCNLALDILK